MRHLRQLADEARGVAHLKPSAAALVLVLLAADLIKVVTLNADHLAAVRAADDVGAVGVAADLADEPYFARGRLAFCGHDDTLIKHSCYGLGLVASMDYESRLICFIDLLGFKAAIDQSVYDSVVRKRIYDVIESLGNGEIERLVYGAIPVVDVDGVRPAREVYDHEVIYNQFYPGIRMEVTQFSDSFVISAPAENAASCEMLIKSIFAVKLMFFVSLGMMMRGGIAVGDLVHVKNGPLFGPAMNEAYGLESSGAIYPRVVVSEAAKKILDANLSGTDAVDLIGVDFDGRYSFDLIDVLQWSGSAIRDKVFIGEQLKRIEEDVKAGHANAHPKIAYLLNRWRSVERDYC